MRPLAVLSLLAAASCMPGQLAPPAPVRNDSWPRLVKEGKAMDLAELGRLLKQARAEGKPLKGHGLSVFEGTKVERFDFEIVDIAKNYIMPKHDLIMFRGSHKKWLDGGNVIAGMSGSPCYVNDKMIGALAYRLGSFQKDALGGITPLEYMVREMDRPMEQAKAQHDERGLPHEALSARPVSAGTAEWGLPHEALSARPVSAGTAEWGPVPVATPLFFRGFRSRTLDAFEKFWQDGNFVTARSAGGSAVLQADDRFEPGSAIGASLMLGDYDITATGTVTFVEGDKVLAFGHPFFGAGEIEMPITTCVVHTTFQGLMTAYKISSPDKVVGSLVHDRANAIFGKMGKTARMVPVTITVRNPKVKTETVVRVQCLDHPQYLAMLVNMAHGETVSAFEPSDNPHLTTSTVTVALKGGRKLQYVDIDQFNPGGGFMFFGGSSLMSKVMQLIRNEHEKPVVDSIDVVTETVNENRSASLKTAWALPEEVDDGGTVRIKCVLKRYRGPEVTRDIEVRLPKGLKKGTEVSLTVGGGDTVAPERAPASNLDEFIEALAKEYKSTQLVAVASLPSYNLMYRGKILDRMPNSALAQLVPTIDETAYLANASLRVSVDTEWVITGSGTVTVKIK